MSIFALEMDMGKIHESEGKLRHQQSELEKEIWELRSQPGAIQEIRKDFQQGWTDWRWRINS
jgi:hypothetical protein